MTLKESERLLDLVRGIASNAQKIISGLEQQGLPQPSLGSDGPIPDFIPALDTRLQELRRELVSDARLLADTFTGSHRLIHERLLYNVHTVTSMRVLYTYNIPKHVPLDGTITFTELATVSGLDEVRLTRILRYLMLDHVFTEPEPGKVAHSAISKNLLENDAVALDWVGLYLEDTLPGAIEQAGCLKKPFTDAPQDCGFTAAHGGSKLSYFEVSTQQPERMKRYHKAMTFATSPGGHCSIQNELINFDWVGAGEAVVVDVGGSRGHAAVELLKYAPALKKAIVQDLPDVVEEARANPLPQAAEVADRLEFQAYSFFDPQPIKDADVYLFRHILHDWPTETAQKIIGNLVPSMKPGSRLIVTDYILFPTGESDPYSSKLARGADLQMMVLHNAKERSLEDWKALIGGASEGLLEFEQTKDSMVVYCKKQGDS